MDHIRKVYTDDTSLFQVCSRSGHQYIMIAYHCDANAIFAAPFKSRSDKHRILSYGTIIQRLKYRNIMVDLQILDNESSTEYKRIIKYDWGVQYQLVPPHIHSRNSEERAIRTFKAHFISTLYGIAPTFPKNLWYLFLPQADLTLNLLRKSTLNPDISV